ncbi:pilus assembly protein TadG-related protein [Novosphingobium sp. RD2P27]|uniref:Pilus assembly protein TadG-related protein n=1 Tax=Novosphingobium kalidii TaxID=3230299 RepID=A0ABV2CZM0_9SPHN
MIARPLHAALQAATHGIIDFLRDSRGNVMMIFGFAIIPLLFSTGMAVDYGRALQTQTRLNAAADAAALAGVSRAHMTGSSTDAAKTAAYNMFVAQARPYLSRGDVDMSFSDEKYLNIAVSDETNATNLKRTVTVSYRGNSANLFAGILGVDTLPVSGSSSSVASSAPDIDFYVLVDTSPSMLLPATTAGLLKMTQKTGGCAFACHTIPDSKENFYKIARTNNIVLRTDLVQGAVRDLATTASDVAEQNGTDYRLGLFSFDYKFSAKWPASQSSSGYYLTSDLASVGLHAKDLVPLTYCRNNQRVCDVNDNDTGTNFTSAMNGVNAIAPPPGNGSKVGGDKPQAVLFIVTDGMRDEKSGSSRYIGPIPLSLCTAIKNRGIRIAVLHTKYLPESASDSWSKTNVRDPYLAPVDKITPALQSCASSNQLFYQVTTDSDISAALNALFQAVVQTARLTS